MKFLRMFFQKTLTVPEKRELVRYVMMEHQTSERRDGRIIDISRSLLHCCTNTARDLPAVEARQKLAHQYPAYGFGFMFNKLCQAGLPDLSVIYTRQKLSGDPH